MESIFLNTAGKQISLKEIAKSPKIGPQIMSSASFTLPSLQYSSSLVVIYYYSIFIQAINVQSTAQYHREGQGNNDTFSQGPASQVQWQRCLRREEAKKTDGQMKMSRVGILSRHRRVCWIRAPLHCCGSQEEIAWPLHAFGYSTLVL